MIFLKDHNAFDQAKLEATWPFATGYLTPEVLLLNMGVTMAKAKVTGQKRIIDGNSMGKWNIYPILDTRQYKVEFTALHILSRQDKSI